MNIFINLDIHINVNLNLNMNININRFDNQRRNFEPSPDQIPLGAQCRTTLGHANLLKPDSVRMQDEGELLNEYLLVRKVIAAWVAYEQKVLKALVKRRMI